MLKIFKSTHSDGKQWKLLSGSILFLEWNQKRRIDVAKEKIASTKCGFSISAATVMMLLCRLPIMVLCST